MPLFSRPRSPAEIVRNLKDALTTLERGGDTKKQEKVCYSMCNTFIYELIFFFNNGLCPEKCTLKLTSNSYVIAN